MKRYVKSVCLSLCLLLAVCVVGCNKDKGGRTDVVLVDFPATASETVNLGDTYRIPRTDVKDEAGNSYRLTVAVTDSNGQSVAVVGGEFDIADQDGYKLVYTAKITDSDVRTMTVTLTVTDTVPPAIVIVKPAAGEVGKLYTLPNITVTDLSGGAIEKTVKVYRMVGDVLGDEVTLNETEDRYTFTPTEEGKFRIVVTATDGAGNTNTKTSDFVVGAAMIDGEVLNGDNAASVNQIASDKVTTIVRVPSAENDDAAYGGGYLSVTHAATASSWVNLKLTTRQPLQTYAEYDYITVWLYAVASETKNDGIVYFSFYNSFDHRVAFPANEWTQVRLSAADFVEKMSVANPTFIPVNYANATSTNHADLTEIRIGDIVGRYDAAFGAEVATGSVTGTTADVKITVTSGKATVPAHTVTVYNADNQIVQATANDGNEHTYALSAGNYRYIVTSDDPMYLGEYTGVFVVDDHVRIELPTDVPEATKAGVAFTIPQAKVFTDGSESGVATATAVFTAKTTGQTTGVTGGTFTPPCAGTLEITYSATGAIEKTLTVTVARADTSTDHALDFSTPDVTADFVKPGADDVFTYHDATSDTPAYVAWTIKNNAATGWKLLKITPTLSLSDIGAGDYVRVKLYAVGTGTYKWRALMCSDQFILGEAANAPASYQHEDRLTLNEWHEVLIPADIFVASYNTKCFLSLRFNQPADGNADNVSEIRFADFAIVKRADLTVAANTESTNPGETITFTVDNPKAVDYKLDILLNGTVVQTFEGTADHNTHDWNTTGATLGVYTLRLTVSGLFVQDTQPALTVHLAGQKTIVVAEHVATVAAGTEITIPEGVVYNGDVATTERATVTATFTATATGVTSTVTGTTYTPSCAGTLNLTYTFEGAETQTAEIAVTRAATSTDHALDFSSVDVVSDFIKPNANNVFTYVPAADGQSAYVAWTIKDDVRAAWQSLKLKPTMTNASIKEGDYVRMKIFGKSTSTTKDWRVLMFSNKLIIGEDPIAATECHYPDRLTFNQWHEVLIPAALFADNIGGTFISVTLNGAGDGNSDSLTEIRFADFAVVKSAELTVTADVQSAGVDEAVTFTVTNPLNVDYTLDVLLNGATVKSFHGTADENTHVWNDAGKTVGTYTLRIAPSGLFAQVAQPTLTVRIAGQKAIQVAEHAASVVAGTEFTIPDGVIFEAGVATAERATVAGEFTAAADSAKTPITGGGTFIPDCSGTLSLTYTYEGCEAVTATIAVTRAPASGTHVLDVTSKDVLLDCVIKNGSNSGVISTAPVSFVAADGDTPAYIKWTCAANNLWTNLNITSAIALDDIADTDTIRLKMYVVADANKNNGQVKFSFYNNTTYMQTFAPNQWVTLSLDGSVFKTQMQAGKQFLPTNFNNANSVNHASVTEVRLADFELVKVA